MRQSALSIGVDQLRAQRLGPPAVEARARLRLRALVDAARTDSPFYARHLAALPRSGWRLTDLEPVTKPLLMASFDDWVTDRRFRWEAISGYLAGEVPVGAPLHEALVCTSSGVTGTAGVFVHSPRAVSISRTAMFSRAYWPWLGRAQYAAFARRGIREAAIVGTGGHYAGNSWMEHARRRAAWIGRALRVFSAQAPLNTLIAHMHEFQPTALVGYTSALLLLAEAQRTGSLAITPAIVVTSGETATTADREALKSAFGCPVRETYASSEALFFGYGCPQGWLHVNADWTLVEPIDADGTPTPDGVFSHSLLITNLSNQLQPLIRYDLGDSVMRRPDRCPCGNPMPALRVAGRRDDTLRLRAWDGRILPVSPVVFGLMAEKVAGLGQWQIRQTGVSALDVQAVSATGVPAGQVEDAIVGELRVTLREHGLGNVTVHLVPGTPRPDPRNGKVRRVVARPS